MSGSIAVLLDVSRIRALASASDATLVDVPWDPNAPQDGARRLRDALGGASNTSSIVLVIGLGFLEIARPELPPLAPDARRALLLRDADRYFPIQGAVAVAWEDGFALGMPETLLASFVRAFEEIGVVDAVVALPQAVARAKQVGGFSTEAALGEHGLIVVRDGAVREVRRVVGVPSRDSASAPTREVDASTVLRAALSARSTPITEQLLDGAAADIVQRRRRGRLWRSAALLAASLVALAWSADRRLDRELTAANEHLAQLASDAAPAQRAALRLDRALTEQQLLVAADSVNSAGTTPSAILARLGALLPKDAFVQRLDWDGEAWRIDGSASDAPRIVPLLDADAHFKDVRIVAASTRFLDAGKQRESFSIAFRAQALTLGRRSGQ